jgi:hypothetical protein
MRKESRVTLIVSASDAYFAGNRVYQSKSGAISRLKRSILSTSCEQSMRDPDNSFTIYSATPPLSRRTGLGSDARVDLTCLPASTCAQTARDPFVLNNGTGATPMKIRQLLRLAMRRIMLVLTNVFETPLQTLAWTEMSLLEKRGLEARKDNTRCEADSRAFPPLGTKPTH